jgi:DHA2 family multidrug resistance protein
VGLGALQVVLDKGQREDWMASHFIQIFTVICVVGLLAFIVWEWREQHPILNLRLLRNRNLAVSSVLMFILGWVLYGSTVLIPQLLETVLGYTAELAGMVLSPGGFVVMALMPMVGLLVTRIDPRKLIAFGFLSLAASMFHMASINAGIDFKTIMMYRTYQMAGLAFLFVPINTLCYSGVPQEQNNQVSSMVNLMRNLGGSFGISFVTTMLARRMQVHQAELASHTVNSNLMQRLLQSMSSTYAVRLGSGPGAMQRAYGNVYGMMQQQAAVLSYRDTILIMAILTLAVMPLLLLARKPKPGEAHLGH